MKCYSTRSTSKKVTAALGALLFLAVALYSGYEARTLLSGPQISVFSPEDGSVSAFEMTDIRGQASNIAFISLNGREIFVDKDGFFSEKVALSEGPNPVTIYARDRFGREHEEVLELVYKDTEGINVSALSDEGNTP